jgi:hypothetical protein
MRSRLVPQVSIHAEPGSKEGSCSGLDLGTPPPRLGMQENGRRTGIERASNMLVAGVDGSSLKEIGWTHWMDKFRK